MGNGNQKMLEKQLFDLKFTAKQLGRQSQKCEKNEKENKRKLKKAIEKGDMETAKIYANNAIREKNQSLQFLRLSSRIDAVSQRVQTAVSMGQLTKSMGGTVKGLDKVLNTMNIEKISAIMDKFESQFEDLDVRTAYMGNAMDQSVAASTPEDEVNTLIQMVADEHGLALGAQLDDAGVLKSSTPAEPEKSKEDDLSARLAALHSSP